MADTDYTLEGAKWGSADLGTAGGVVTWAVDSTIPASDLASITAALAEWSKVANIQFQEVASTAQSEIDFTSGAIDGAGSTLAVTSYGFSAGQLQNATVEFDSGDSLSGANLTLVAAHEIGHAIGLGHYNAAAAVMNSTANFSLTGLTQSDIDGIQALYGANTSTTPAATDTPVADNTGTTTTTGGTAGHGTSSTTPSGTTTTNAGGHEAGGTGGTETASNGTGGHGTSSATPSGTTATGAGGHAAGGSGGTETASSGGHTGAGSTAGSSDGSTDLGHLGGHSGSLPSDIASLLQGLHGSHTSTATASNTSTHSASAVDLSSVMHSHFEHMWT